MADKSLSESAWKAFAKKKTLKDAAFVSALGKFEAASKQPPKMQLDLLEALQVQSKALRKAYKDDKELGKYLDDVDKAAEKEARALDEDGPAKLTTAMKSLVKEVRSGHEMYALIAIGGKELAVMLSRKEITQSSHRTLTDFLGVSAGVKFYPATCIFEANAHTFVMDARPAKIGQRLKQALLDQTNEKCIVRVRSADPADVEEDGGAAPGAPGGPEGEADEKPVPVAREADGAPAAERQPAEPPADPLRQAYEEHRAALEPRLADALGKQRGDVGKLRALSAFAGGKAEAGDFRAAAQALQALESALAIAEAAPADLSAPGAPDADPMAAFKARLVTIVPAIKAAIDAGKPGADAQRLKVAEATGLANKKDFAGAAALLDQIDAWLKDSAGSAGGAGLVALQKSRLAWDGLRKSIQTQLRSLEQELVSAVQRNNDDPEATEEFDPGELATAIGGLHTHLDKLDDRLITVLDTALGAAAEERQSLRARAAELVKEYQSFIDSDALIALIDENGFTPTTIRGDAQKVLADLAAQL